MDRLLTIFTPTYNRAYTLPKLYHSLCRQTDDNFEWLIIDDASSDDTEDLIRHWQEDKSKFLIRYYKQEHGGKHRAINKGVKLAQGDFFFIVDSDDVLSDDAVKQVNVWADMVRKDPGIAAVSGLRVSKEGKVWGGFPQISNEYIDASGFERRKYGLEGDKAEIYKTEVLRKFQFPEFEDEYFMTEDVCWLNIAAAGYKIRWYNRPIYICEYLEDGLTNSGANTMEGHRKNYRGYCFYISECMSKKPFVQKMIHIREYDRTARSLKKSMTQRSKDINMSVFGYCISVFCGVPVGYVFRKLLYKGG
ncbi:MAG: glycosyltransferase family 2 protein [Lachnospiraceae bacterium]|nr:glycosyltransferase family 2 protein [Lachnospiraceae bacterium]